MTDVVVEQEEVAASTDPIRVERSPWRTSRTRRAAMRPRRLLVRVHRWLSIGLFLWIVIVATTGAWLVVHDAVESWINPDRYAATGGDIGAQAAVDAATAELPEDAYVYGLTTPRNGRGVYQVYGEVPPPAGASELAEPSYVTAYVDPGSGEVNGIRSIRRAWSTPADRGPACSGVRP